MKASGRKNKADEPTPALFSFITLRREPFGALLFNPFLAIEKEFDERGALVAELCDGKHTAGGIAEACCASFGISLDEATHVVASTITELERMCAIDHAEKPFSKRPPTTPPVSSAFLCAPKSVIWDLTYACNLSCPHCLTASGTKMADELDTVQACKLIDILSEARVLYLSLVGGEPLLRKDIITLLNHIAGTGMRVDIATNGLTFPTRMIKALHDLPIFHIQVSIDGIGAEHDEFRGHKGAFKRACGTLRRLKAEGMSTSISTTATARNIGQLADIADLAVELGCDAFKAIPFIPAGRGKSNAQTLELDQQGTLQLCKTLTDASRRYAGALHVVMESTFGFLLAPPEPSKDQDGMMICSAGYDTLSIGADGTAYPCPFLHSFPLGNLMHEPMERIWHESPVLASLRTLKKEAMHGPCGSCEYAPAHCRGGCRASAFFGTGSLNGSDPLCFKNIVQPLQDTNS